MSQTTRILYQVEADHGVYHTRRPSLKGAFALAQGLCQDGVQGVQIARYDASKFSDYYEIVSRFPRRH